MYQPLADELRPRTLDEVYGQEEILGEGKVLRRMIESGRVPNLIFYGPSGTGKTTVANIIADATKRTLFKLNATTASTADIRDIVAQLDTLLAPNGVLLYLDEIQSFNKRQQQSLLEHIENGKITLIASTTENPYFYIFNAILSRCTVFEFKPITPAAAKLAIDRAIDTMAKRYALSVSAQDGALAHIATSCGGDIRKAINAVEALFIAARPGDTTLEIRLDDARAVTQRSAMRYDREGDNHFDCLSALMKSIRGSDPDAAIHYLARFLEVGDLPACCRRILCSACEDIGLAYPQAIPIVKACVDAALQLGMPEARLPLADAVILLATAPKSNSGYLAIDAALADVRAGKTGNIPRELQNVHADSEGAQREQGYLYPHDYPNHWVKQQYLPDILKNARYYAYGENKTEQTAKRYWDERKGEA
ncbi:MAG: replication-associated recombination protein A [Oscillospiraceae bacterium]|jgi:putative ATPase|nr:replication-associated recombination protein A [Oscillospiraceae bacterium]